MNNTSQAKRNKQAFLSTDPGQGRLFFQVNRLQYMMYAVIGLTVLVLISAHLISRYQSEKGLLEQEVKTYMADLQHLSTLLDTQDVTLKYLSQTQTNETLEDGIKFIGNMRFEPVYGDVYSLQGRTNQIAMYQMGSLYALQQAIESYENQGLKLQKLASVFPELAQYNQLQGNKKSILWINQVGLVLSMPQLSYDVLQQTHIFPDQVDGVVTD